MTKQVRPGIYMRYENVGEKSGTGSLTRDGSPAIPESDAKLIDSMFYETLEEAMEAAEDGGIVRISADTAVTSSIRIPEGKSVTVRVPRGVTLSVDAGSSNYGMVVKGDLTIEGGGDIVLTGFGFGTSMNTDSRLTIKSGHFIAKGCTYIIGCFDGEVVIEDGTFEGEYCVVNNFSDHYSTDGKVTIMGGTFMTSDEAGFDVLGGPVKIRGGRFSKPVDETYCAEGTTIIEGEDGFYTVS